MRACERSRSSFRRGKRFTCSLLKCQEVGIQSEATLTLVLDMVNCTGVGKNILSPVMFFLVNIS